ncbi:MAG: hypothetical protein ABSG84_10060 [Acidobacteriaceae bacterium]
MTTLLLGATALAVVALGWFGYRAFVRIETWGRKMNDCDRIFQEAGIQDDEWEPEVSKRRPPRGIALAPALKVPHHHAGTAASK